MKLTIFYVKEYKSFPIYIKVCYSSTAGGGGDAAPASGFRISFLILS